MAHACRHDRIEAQLHPDGFARKGRPSLPGPKPVPVAT